MTKDELMVMHVFNMKQRLHEHIMTEEVAEHLASNDNTLLYQIAKVPFDIDALFTNGDISNTDLNLRLDILKDVSNNDTTSLYEKYVEISPSSNLIDLFLLEAAIANISLRQQCKFTCVLYSSVTYNPEYGTSVDSLVDFLEQSQFAYES